MRYACLVSGPILPHDRFPGLLLFHFPLINCVARFPLEEVWPRKDVNDVVAMHRTLRGHFDGCPTFKEIQHMEAFGIPASSRFLRETGGSGDSGQEL